MSDPIPETDARAGKSAAPPRQPNRWGMGTLAMLQLIFLAVLLVAANYLAAHHFYRWDFSREANYTLSPATKRYLASDALAKREKPVKWIMAFRRSSPFYERVRALADDYGRLSHGKIELEVVDPLRSPDRTQEVIATYDVALTKDLIVIDARPDDSAVSTADAAGNTILNPYVKIVPAEDMSVHAMVDRQRKIVGFQGEDVLTARLVEAIEGRARIMYFLADQSQLASTDEDSPIAALHNSLQFQNVELRGLSLAGLDAIPADAEGLAIVAPKYDFTDQGIAVLEQYWNRPKAAMLVLLKAGDAPAKLRTFLRSYGVTPQRDRVIAQEKGRIVTDARGVFTPGVPFTRDFELQSTEFAGATSSLEVREGAEDLMHKQINPIGLIEAAPGFWGESKFGEKDVSFDEREDTKPPFYLAACVIRGAASDDRFAADTSRMVVIANTDFLDPDRQRAENADFLAASVNWLMNRESLAGIGPRSLGTYKLPLLDAQVSFINRVNLFFLPAFLALVGALVWASRRA